MTTIRLHNTATKQKEVFAPLDPANVRMYVCGPTVYDRAHLGNARPVVVFDVLFRLLRHVYGPDHVTYVRNFTDVDDKINAEALRRRQAGAEGTLEDLIRQRTEETIGWYHADMDALGALRPTAEPRATEFIAPMVAMIQTLIDRGHAYEVEGHVLFDVRSYVAYGELSGRSVDDMIAGARVEVAPWKRDPMDFVLWKPSDTETPGWDSPWGRGRPGWHIECSAMSHELLGPAFDIHGGGIDLQFPHHENEIAQSRCAHPDEGFAKVWMHNEMLLVEGKKMSKSLGNFFTVRDLLDQGVPGEVIRFVFLGTHYSKQMDWGRRKTHDAKLALDEMAKMLGIGGVARLVELTPGEPLPEVVEALADDLNTHLAISLIRRRSFAERYSTTERQDRLGDLYATQLLLGFDLKDWPIARAAAEHHDGFVAHVGTAILLQPAMELAKALDAARAAKNFAEADRLRGRLQEAGLIVKSGPEGTTLEPGPTFAPEKLEEIL